MKGRQSAAFSLLHVCREAFFRLGRYAYKIDYVNYTSVRNVEKFTSIHVGASKGLPEQYLGTRCNNSV
jgi:hypothetical protein